MSDPEDPALDEEEIEDDGPPESAEDIALRPGPNADSPAEYEKYISAEVRALYDVYSYRHAAALLYNSFPDELAEIEQALLAFSITMRDIGMPGGNESIMPKKISASLRPKGWMESQIQGDLTVRLKQFIEKQKGKKVKKELASTSVPRVIANYIDGHKIDYVKGRVAFDLEWNSKDQTFDRDLYALRAFHECGVISAGVLLTRSRSLNPVFEHVPKLTKEGKPVLHKNGPKEGAPASVRDKYGASTTWMGKLLYRLNAGRHGGCPILVFGITPKLISDWKPPA